ncbi:MAG TPA: class I SAM-dependent methyltransferase [Ktedonobacteraceae bacterium]|jgi:ubiquinone/menaquinone biosynthesis C-methylase UbiE|nr:class I SAM-dependent methyltransferase [Ktedonobacteraceae bacterium]
MSEQESNKNTYVIDPESGAEMARLIDQDITISKAIGALFPGDIVPESGQKVLDVACGPGGWALEVAFEYPEVQVEGIDISQAMIAYANMRAQSQQLTNAHFQVMNVLEPLAFADNTFDLVNARLMTSFLPRDAWPRVVKELARITRHDGVIIHTECETFGESNSQAIEELSSVINEAMYRAGLYIGKGRGVTAKLPQFLQEAGCTNIQQEQHVLDSSYGTPTHKASLENLRVGIQLVRPFVLRLGLVTPEKFDELFERSLQDMQSERMRGTWTFVTVWGIKDK